MVARWYRHTVLQQHADKPWVKNLADGYAIDIKDGPDPSGGEVEARGWKRWGEVRERAREKITERWIEMLVAKEEEANKKKEASRLSSNKHNATKKAENKKAEKDDDVSI